jgi:hypothetical protein
MGSDAPSPFFPLVGRLTWLLIGPMALVFLAIGIVRAGTGWLTALDIAFFLILAAMCLGRWLEFRGGNPRTPSGEPAAPPILRRYVLLALTLGTGVWVAANFLGNHVLVNDAS